MNNIQHLLKKYSTPYTNGEKRTPEYEKTIKQQQRLKQRLIKLDLLLNETPVNINPAQRRQIQHLIIEHNNFKKLHGNASEETIILAFIFYTKKIETPQIKIDRYTVSQKYKLTHNTFETIICRLLQHTLMNTPIKPTTNTKIEHEKLLKQGRTKQ